MDVSGIVTAIAQFVGRLWWDWTTIRSKPGVNAVLARVRQPTIPRVRPGEIGVVVTRMASDGDGFCEREIIDAVAELHGVCVLRAPVAIPTSRGPRVKDDIEKAKREAMQLLERSGAHLVLWGTRVHEDLHILQLRQASRFEYAHATSSRRVRVGESQHPNDLLADITQHMSLLLRRRLAQVEEGRYVVATLTPIIDQVRALLRNPSERWRHCCQANLRCDLGHALTVRGLQAGRREDFLESIAQLRASLEYFTRERNRYHWFRARNRLSNALHALGTLERGTALYREAIEGYREILREFSFEKESEVNIWCMVANNAAVVFHAMAERDDVTEPWLEASVALYERVCALRTPEKAPRDWVQSQYNLAAGLYGLWGKTRDVRHVKRAVDCCLDARALVRDTAPLDWASATHNAAITMHAWSEHLTGAERLARLDMSIALFREALEVRHHDEVPWLWAESATALAVALNKRGELKRDPAPVREALSLLTQALGKYSIQRTPAEWPLMKHRVGRTLQLLAELEGTREALYAALTCYEEMRDALDPERDPYFWPLAEGSVGVVLSDLGKREPGTRLLEEALVSLEAAAAVFMRHKSELLQLCWEHMSTVMAHLTLRGKPRQVLLIGR